MAQLFLSPVFQFSDSAGRPYAGGTLTFYASGTTTPLDTYNDPDLDISHVNANPITLNSAGWPNVEVFLQNLLYKVVLKDADGVEIWTRDPVSTTDFSSVAITKVGTGDPNGSVAGTAGSAGVLPTMYWDFNGSILYVCTTTGNAATAAWTAINAQAATPTVSPPQGYLTPTPGTTIITSDASASTFISYEPFVGNLVPIYNGSRMVPTEFSALTLELVSSHTANTIFDVFVFNNEGVPTLATGPAWSSSSAGSSSRGTGAGTTQLTRLNGYWVNAVSMTGRNGTDTATIGANLATYVGSLFIDGSNGQITCHRSWGQSRKWGVWNAYNRQPLYLKGGDSTATWSPSNTDIRASNGSSSNSLTVFQGLAEEALDLSFEQNATIAATTQGEGHIGIGWNSTTAFSERTGIIKGGDDNLDVSMVLSASVRENRAPAIGINVVTALEREASGSITFMGGAEDMVLSARWRG